MKLLFLSFLLIIVQSNNLRTTRHIDPKYQPKFIMQSNTICYGVMFDAGSSGTRVYVYQWNCRETQTMSYINVNEDAPAKKIKPGLSTFADNIDGLHDYFQQFIEFANENVPSKMRKYTPIMLGATAGMRLLPQHKQDLIIQEVTTIFQKTEYLVLNKQWIRVINGQEEGAYLWLSINYLLQNLSPSSQETAVTIDLGGASTQIAFKVEENIQENEMDLVIPNYNSYQLYSISHLYYGSDQAQIKVDQLIDNQSNPCYFSGYTLGNLIGTGNINQCRDFIRKYINNDPANCKFTHCGVNGEYQPEIQGNLIYGVSGIQSVAELLKLTRFTLDELYIECIKFCSLTWKQVMEKEEYRNNPYIQTDFFMVLYVHELLQYGYGIKETQVIESPELIKEISPTWTLAAMFYQVGQIDCHNDSPVCSSLIYVV